MIKPGEEIELKGKAAVAFLLGLILWVVLVDALQAWIVMLALGAIHSHYDSVPAYSFWASFLVLVVVKLIGGITFSKKKA